MAKCKIALVCLSAAGGACFLREGVPMTENDLKMFRNEEAVLLAERVL